MSDEELDREIENHKSPTEKLLDEEAIKWALGKEKIKREKLKIEGK